MVSCPHCVLSKAVSVLHVPILPRYQQWVPTWGHPWCQGQRPCEQALRVTESRHPCKSCYMKIFSCRGDGEWQLLEEPRFHSCETTHPSASACWIVIIFNSTFKWELLLWNCACSSVPGLFVPRGSVVWTSFLQALLWMWPLNSVGAWICITFILKDNVKHAIISQTTGEYMLQLWKTNIQNIMLVTLKTPQQQKYTFFIFNLLYDVSLKSWDI